ncbi:MULTISPECIES: hypothetical protein [unclassified Nocardioides]|uniref:hypothetical protein n=1 Tax=unclassified Nocardioides TaxID=2615069 RepID=UPI0012E3F7DB|nr:MULTISPECIES: hypothetical protein [unclassified Nocardioides]
MSDADGLRDVFRTEQSEAAADQVDETLREIADELGIPVFYTSEVESVRAALSVWRFGRGWLTGCRHVVGSSPRPVYGLLARPGRIWCAACWLPKVVQVADRKRCDLCGRRGDSSALVVLGEGMATLFAFVCPSCRVPPPDDPSWKAAR